MTDVAAAEHNNWQSPLSTRYASAEMRRIFSNQEKFLNWRRLWLALAEAEQRRKAARSQPSRPPEHNGPQGPEPTRYGDWEKNGIVSDF